MRERSSRACFEAAPAIFSARKAAISIWRGSGPASWPTRSPAVQATLRRLRRARHGGVGRGRRCLARRPLSTTARPMTGSGSTPRRLLLFRQELREEMRSYLDRGYETVKMKIGGAPWSRTYGASTAVGRLAVDANGRSISTPRLPMRARSIPSGCFGSRSSAIELSPAGGTDAALCGRHRDGEKLFSLQDALLIRHAGHRPKRQRTQATVPTRITLWPATASAHLMAEA